MAQREPRRIVIPSKEELLQAAQVIDFVLRKSDVEQVLGHLLQAGGNQIIAIVRKASDVDTLYISLKEKTNPTHSESDVDDLVVFDYEGEELVGIEIMDITGQLKYANPS